MNCIENKIKSIADDPATFSIWSYSDKNENSLTYVYTIHIAICTMYVLHT